VKKIWLLVLALTLAVAVPAAPAPAKPAKKCAKKHAKKKNCHKKKKKAKKPRKRALKPVDYTKIKGLSQPKYTSDQISNEATTVAGQDGTDLYVEVNRPKLPGKYPVIMEISGYHGTLYNRQGTRILPDPKGKDGEPLGLVGYFVPRGYAVVMVDVRGTGKSGGCLDHLGPNDFSDFKTVIEWAAKQGWSNGRVGVTGHSYVGGTTNVSGATGAKGLATIVPSASLASMYDHQFQAGVPYNAQYLGPIEAYEQLAIQSDLPPQLSGPLESAGEGGAGEDFGMHPADTGCGLANSAALAGTGQVTGQYEAFHAQRDYRDKLKKAPIPIFLQHGTLDQAARIGGSTWMFERGLPRGDKLWIGQWDHGIGAAPTRRGLQWAEALHAWFDKQLMQRKVRTGPALEVFLNDEKDNSSAFQAQGEVLTGSTLPKTTPFVLSARPDEGLGEAPKEEGSVSFTGDPRGYEFGAEETGGATFETEPVIQDHLLFGIPQLRLQAGTTDPQTHLIATLYAVDDDGMHRRLTQCAMNPILKDGVDKTAALVPQQLYALNPPCFAVAFRVREGERLRLRVTTSDTDKLPVHSTDPNVVVGFGGKEGTQLTLPEVARKTYPDNIDLGDTSGDETSTG
jgi:predicted acyl esterase